MSGAKIVVLEDFEMEKGQEERLRSLGEVEMYDFSDAEECEEVMRGADVVVVNWIDPNLFLEDMKSPSLLALMSTGYSWVDTEKARRLDISVSNIPDYSVRAVAEHDVGLMFAVARKTMVGDRNIRSGRKDKGYLEGIELRGRTLGIIGLGSIGRKVASMAGCLGMDIVTYNRHEKNVEGIEDISLVSLLERSDVVCVTCSLNEDSRNMLGIEEMKRMKDDAILVGSTWNVVTEEAMIEALENDWIRGIGFDVAVEGEEIDLPEELLQKDDIVLTPHIGYNTEEAKERQVDTLIENIESYLEGNPQNIIN